MRKIIILLAVVILSPALFLGSCTTMVAAIGSGGTGSSDDCDTTTTSTTGGTNTTGSTIPANLIPIYFAAQRAYGVPWNVLAAINKVETDFGRSTLPGVHSGANSAGAMGWMQFEPSTWAEYGVDANNDGVKDPYNSQDAIFGAANMLKANGAPDHIYQAIFLYNHADWYVRQVLGLAKQYAELGITDPGGSPAPSCSPTGTTGQYAYPLESTGTIVGCPFQGTHLNPYKNWQSDNALDLGTPVGTKVIAVADGVIGPRIGSLHSSASNLQGLRLTLEADGNDFFYQHLSELLVKAGQTVKRGQILGYSGFSNVAHLHFGMHARYNPARAIGLPATECPDSNWVWPSWLPLDTTAENGSPLRSS